MVQTVKLGELISNSKKRRNEEREEHDAVATGNNKSNNSNIDDNDDEDDESEIDISSTDSEVDDNGSDEFGVHPLGKNKKQGNKNGDADNSDDEEIVNIDFDFFDANPNVDFHATKNLLRQLFGQQESNKLQLSQLADLILNSPTTTIKTDGPESDPYCFLSFVDYRENKDSDYVKYLIKTDGRLASFFKSIDNSNGKKSCALVMSERLINMPPEVVPPLYRITLEDAKKSREDDREYDFYVILGRKYEVNFDMDTEGDGGNGGSSEKGERSKKRVKNEGVDYFHEEDRFFEKLAKIHFETDSQKGLIRSFMVLDHEGLVEGINELEREMSKW